MHRHLPIGLVDSTALSPPAATWASHLYRSRPRAGVVFGMDGTYAGVLEKCGGGGDGEAVEGSRLDD